MMIVDLKLPEMDGFEILARLRNDIKYSHIPVIVITDQDVLSEKLRAFELGADDYLVKPFQPEELVARMGIDGHARPRVGGPNKFEKAASAKVSMVEAIATARENVSGAVIKTELEQKHDRLIWEIEVVTTEKQVKEVHIDAQTGTIIHVEEEKVKSKRIHRRH